MKYLAKYVNNYDGDTIDVSIEIWPGITLVLDNARLIDIDTPEMNSSNPKERELAQKAKDYLRKRLEHRYFFIEPIKKEKYGRWLIKVYLTEEYINQTLIDEGYARPYDGSKRKSWF